jgi:hypothetical protein
MNKTVTLWLSKTSRVYGVSTARGLYIALFLHVSCCATSVRLALAIDVKSKAKNKQRTYFNLHGAHRVCLTWK